MQTTSFSKDWTDIIFSLERLAKGTCGGEKDNKICTWDLMPRIREALTKHIATEEQELFPHLTAQDQEQHQLEHKRLLELLSMASYEFECGYGEQLSAIVYQLIKALRDHHEELERMVA